MSTFTERAHEWLGQQPPASPLYIDGGTPVAEPSRVPVESLLTQILEELQRINSTPRDGAASSIQIEDNPTKDRAVRVTTKIYAGSELDVMHALDLHGLAHLKAEQRAMAGWIETIEALKA